MSHECRALHVRTHHHARAIHQAEHRYVESVTQLDEPCTLVSTVGVDGAREVMRIVGDDAHRGAFHADEGGDHADTESLADLQHRVGVCYRIDDLAHVVKSQAVLGDDVAKAPLVRGFPPGDRALEVGEVLLRDDDRFRLVLDEDVDDPVGHLERHRPHLFRRVDSESAAFDHGRAAHPDGRAFGGDDDIAARQQRRVAGEASTIRDPHHRNASAELRELGKRVSVEGDPWTVVVVARAASATLAEQHQRQPEATRKLEHAVLLVVVAPSLRARQHGVVIRDHHGP